MYFEFGPFMFALTLIAVGLLVVYALRRDQSAPEEHAPSAKRQAAFERGLMQRRRDKVWFRVEGLYSELVERTEANNLTPPGAERGGVSAAVTEDEVKAAFESFIDG